MTPDEAQIARDLTVVGLPPDIPASTDGPAHWFNDYGGPALRAAYLAGWAAGYAASTTDQLATEERERRP